MAKVQFGGAGGGHSPVIDTDIGQGLGRRVAPKGDDTRESRWLGQVFGRRGNQLGVYIVDDAVASATESRRSSARSPNNAI